MNGICISNWSVRGELLTSEDGQLRNFEFALVIPGPVWWGSKLQGNVE